MNKTEQQKVAEAVAVMDYYLKDEYNNWADTGTPENHIYPIWQTIKAATEKLEDLNEQQKEETSSLMEFTTTAIEALTEENRQLKEQIEKGEHTYSQELIERLRTELDKAVETKVKEGQRADAAQHTEGFTETTQWVFNQTSPIYQEAKQTLNRQGYAVITIDRAIDDFAIEIALVTRQPLLTSEIYDAIGHYQADHYTPQMLNDDELEQVSKSLHLLSVHVFENVDNPETKYLSVRIPQDVR